ncbi:BON domain-containing protein [Nitrospira moscoviensis]|uniref:BON domain-containing protein n=1 Tax=Nitrospira moscoviensis TaxID=42253 RepID=A0A0K2GE33_NITMO|nr:BON domain-containing protein [Nitrospira moscoviensis]ALA59220.1 hypothetical protein NITMOv2_2811 [Nitrospira moscoviensis]
MNRGFSLLGGAGLGAGLMYLFDPDRGRRRRALLRDKAVHWSKKTRDAAETAGRDLRNRSRGVAASVMSRIKRSGPVADRVLEERVRSTLGMAMRHPASIDVSAAGGVVRLRGPVLAEEVAPILAAVDRVEGVTRVDNQLEPHEEPGRIPDLQGGVGRRAGGPRFELLQANWSPAARLLTGVAGTAALFYGVSRRTFPAVALAAAGIGLLARSITNRELARLFGGTGSNGAGRGSARPEAGRPREAVA